MPLNLRELEDKSLDQKQTRWALKAGHAMYALRKHVTSAPHDKPGDAGPPSGRQSSAQNQSTERENKDQMILGPITNSLNQYSKESNSTMQKTNDSARHHQQRSPFMHNISLAVPQDSGLEPFAIPEGHDHEQGRHNTGMGRCRRRCCEGRVRMQQASVHSSF